MTHASGRRLVRRLRRMMPRNSVSSAKPTRTPAHKTARIRVLSTLAQSTAAKCPMIAAEKITTGTHMAPDMGIRWGP